MIVALVICVTASPAYADDTTGGLPTNTVSLGVGIPAAVGGLASLEWLHRLDQRNFVMVGAGTAVFLSGAYLSYGRRLSPGAGSAWFTFVGVDTDVFVAFGGEPTYLPGAHVGVGKEWFPGAFRLALTLNTGFPWLGGLRFSVGL